MAKLDIRVNRKAPGDQYFENQAASMPDTTRNELATTGGHKLDSEESRATLRKLLQWYFLEREKQSENRMEMAMDSDFYDNLQWDPEDAQTVKDRGQMPLVYNEVAPMVDWIIGTERRSKVDWNVLPRTEDDVDMADVKTKVLKFVSDINRVPFVRSRAFADASKVGVGWMDDGARDDPTEDILYSKYEDWRHVLHDSACYELDLSDARYIFRWRWVDEDVALMMFPDRRDKILRAVENFTQAHDATWEEETWYTRQDSHIRKSGQLFASGTGVTVDAKRRQVKLIEAQYRMPVRTRVIASGPLKGTPLHPNDTTLHAALAQVGGTLIDKIVMRVHMAVFTETDLLALGESVYRHNRFSLTPVWCYRRGRDRLPYGVIRRVRDIQQDLNKRASKALFMLNTNQIFAEEDAVEDWDQLRDEVDRPDGLIVHKKGKEIVVRRDTDAATGQIQMMTMDAQNIQKSAGVSQENLGRQTNAVSGEAIKARQNQGSVVTTEPFDNLRLATQIQGEKQLSLTEQFYSEEKVIRLTGSKGVLQWVRINKPEQQPDGSTRYINDITATQADFIVAEQDYAGTLRQVMFDSLRDMASKLPPEVSMRVLRIAMEFSDLPNKDEIVQEIRKVTGEQDPNKKMTPEEAQQAQQQMQQQAEALQLQRETAMTALQEAQARVREINAKAMKLESEANAAGQGGLAPEAQQAMQRIQSQAADQIDKLSQALSKAQGELANRTMALNKESDNKLELARIDQDTKLRVAEIQKANDTQLLALEKRIEDLMRGLQDANKAAADAAKLAAAAEKAIKDQPAPTAAPTPAPTAAPTPAPTSAPPAPLTINVQVDAKPDTGPRSVIVQRDKDGNLIGATVSDKQAPKGKK